MFRDFRSVLKGSSYKLVRGGRALVASAIVFAIVTLPGMIRALREQPFELGGREQAQTLLRMYNLDVMRQLAACPPSMVLTGMVTYYCLPVITLLIAYDSIARERRLETHGLGYPGATCSSLVAGKIVAAWFCYACITFLSQMAIWGFEIIKRPGLRVGVIGWAARLYSVACVQALALIGIWVLMSCLFKRAWVASVLGFGLIVAFALARRSQPLAGPYWGSLISCLPATIDAHLLSGSVHDQVIGVVIAGLWTACVVAVATRVLHRAPELLALSSNQRT